MGAIINEGFDKQTDFATLVDLSGFCLIIH